MSPLSASNLFSLKGHVALVTGGGTGIGLMVAQALSSNGAKTYITGRRLEVIQRAADHYGAEAKSSGGSIIPLQMDVTDKASIKAAVEKIKQEDGHLTLLVNNAGQAKAQADLKNIDQGAEALAEDMFNVDESEWASLHAANITSVYYVSAACLPLLSAASHKFNSSETPFTGSIINIASVGALIRSSFGMFAYQAGKAAVNQLTQNMATTFSHEKIKVRVNSICPGWFASEMTLQTSDEKTNKSTMDASDPRVQRIPLKRAGSEADLAQAVLMLAKNQYVTGEILALEGGVLRVSP